MKERKERCPSQEGANSCDDGGDQKLVFSEVKATTHQREAARGKEVGRPTVGGLPLLAGSTDSCKSCETKINPSSEFPLAPNYCFVFAHGEASALEA